MLLNRVTIMDRCMEESSWWWCSTEWRPKRRLQDVGLTTNGATV